MKIFKKQSNIKRLIYIFILLFCGIFSVEAQTVISGAIIDSETGDSIPFATVRYKGHKVMTKCNAYGTYSISRHEGWKISISAVGYKTQVVEVVRETANEHLDIRLQPEENNLAEIVVKSKSSKYSRKNNPAVELMKRVIAAKKQNKLENNDFYSYDNYQKVKFALNDIQPFDLDKGIFKKQTWLRNQVEACGLNNKLILPLMIEEKVSNEIYRKDPESRKSIIIGEKASGLNDIFETGDIVNIMVKDVFSTIDIYDDQVRFLRQRFTSPIGKDAIDFYRFYIVDTLKVGNDSCYHLTFLPNNQQDIGFRGDLYIVKDDSLHVKKVSLGLPASSIVNFVTKLEVEQEYDRLPSGIWALSKNDLLVELEILTTKMNFVVIRQSRLSNYSFEPIAEKLFKGKQKEETDVRAGERDDAFWAKYRGVPLNGDSTGGEDMDAMNQFIDHLFAIKGFKWVAWVLKAFIENYIETSTDGHSKFDLGPVNTFISHNDMDGFRFRIGGTTTANLNPHVFLSGYVAHGMNTQNNYYKANLLYSFNRKKYSQNEFPRRHIAIESSFDICSPTDRFLHTDKDNMFTSFKWSKSQKMMLYNTQKIEFVREQYNGVKMKAIVKFEENEATGGLFFKPLSEYDGEGFKGGIWEDYYKYDENSLHNGKIRTTELHLELEYAPGAQYFSTKQRQRIVNREAPIFTLAHDMGIKGFAGGQYSYHATEAKIFKRVYLNSWGILNCTLDGGIQWSQVPYPLLMAPATNMSYIINDESFNLINSSEFMNDKYASLFLSWDMHGKILNRIPYIRRLKWREFIGFRTLWGSLTDKNNPNLPENWHSDVLMAFPEGYNLMNPKVPYCECIVGIHNVFKFFNFDYVRRLNYLDQPETSRGGFRFSFHLTF